jgi:serine/threonine protein kinase
MADLGNRYRIASTLGAGNYGTTYLARDLHKPSQPLCVVKQLRHQAPKILKLFRQEAVMLEKLGNHPQIPALIDYFNAGGQFYIVQDYIEGHDLRREIQPGKVLSEGYVLKLLRDVLTAELCPSSSGHPSRH